MKLYFAYGANLNLRGMADRCPAAQPIRALVLNDWELAFNGVATILPRDGAKVHGALWAITDACEDSLDLFEGYPYLYTKLNLEQAGEQFMVYVMNEDIPAPPSRGYLNTIAEGYRHWDLPTAKLYEVVDTYYNLNESN